ncbi:MAG: hypothetical protein ACI4LI_05375, partial [Candidatus Fimenecus sp.]
PDLLVRSQTLYPAELAAQMRLKYSFDRRNIIPPTAENVNNFFGYFLLCRNISRSARVQKGELCLSAAGASPRSTL